MIFIQICIAFLGIELLFFFVLLRKYIFILEQKIVLAVRQEQSQEQISLRERITQEVSQLRQELTITSSEMSRNIVQQMTAIASIQNQQIELFSKNLFRVNETIDRCLEAFRDTLSRQLRELQLDNASKLDIVRQTVDEKLQTTLESRLNSSFQLVSERLEQVHRGLGEMQALASDVGDLRRLLTNVKIRGTWGEVQLAALLEQLLSPEQYASDVVTIPGAAEKVEFAVRLPGRGNPEDCVWLPIDAKFPREDYERLVLAQEKGDVSGVEIAGRQLEQRIRLEARTIQTKYISPPYTTDFALMFLPTEGLYAELIRRPGLVDGIQRKYRVVISGPTNLAALLSSLQMGFRSVAVEKRSSEVWQLLGAVKTEFGKFGDILSKAKEQIDRASATLGNTTVRTRAIERHLRGVQSLPQNESTELLPEDVNLSDSSEKDSKKPL